MNVMITGAGRACALGYNLVLRYLENGDTVVATVRKDSQALLELQKQYGARLHILVMDIGSTTSVEKARNQLMTEMTHLDLLINNAVTVSPDYGKEFFDTNLDYIAHTVDVSAVGAMRVIQSFYGMLKKSQMTALIMRRRAVSVNVTERI